MMKIKSGFLLLMLVIVEPSLGLLGSKRISKDMDDIYSIAGLSEAGLSKKVFQLALEGFNSLENQKSIIERDILTIIDYSQTSRNKRLYVIDLKRKKLLFNTLVAHGRNTGDEFAKFFSNKEGSLKSCLGFFITGNSFVSPHTGLSLTINGVEKGFNDNAVKRAIIIHSAEYVSERFINHYGRLGRSYGCPVLPSGPHRQIIEVIKGGSCLFIYFPDKDYLSPSVLLNN
jgi:hypothetical protein